MKKRKLFSILSFSIRSTAKYSGKYLFLFMAIHLAYAAFSAGTTILKTLLFNTVERVIDGDKWTTALLPLILLGFCVAAGNILLRADRNYKKLVEIKARNGLLIPLNQVCAKLEPMAFENPVMLDRIGKAVSGATECEVFACCILYMLTNTVPYILILTIYFWTLRPVLAWSAVMIFLPVLLTQVLRLVMFRKLEDEVAPIRRENDYFDRCISHRDYFKETRLLGAYGYFARRFRDSLRAYYRASSRTEVRSGLYNLVSQIIVLVGYFGVLFLLFDSVMGGYISIGSFAAVFASLAEYISMIWIFVEEDLGTAVKSYGAVRNYVDFVRENREEKRSTVIQNRGEIHLKDVHFAYPEAEKETIRGISFTIHSGETLAVVGENGAGKSTLMRLITGQCLPTMGKVIVDGCDLAELNMESRFANVSAVYQKFGRYRMTAEENITLSSPEGDEAAMLHAARNGDVHLDDPRSFPEGKDTMLSREFGGVDLSGGQWQRIAVARGLYRTHDLVILDEPTAAIDPIEETKLYKRFSEISQGKTAIIVTHRLGSARIADRILVMKDGLVDDVGTHDELIAKGGHYARLYESQAEWYQ